MKFFLRGTSVVKNITRRNLTLIYIYSDCSSYYRDMYDRSFYANLEGSINNFGSLKILLVAYNSSIKVPTPYRWINGNNYAMKSRSYKISIRTNY